MTKFPLSDCALPLQVCKFFNSKFAFVPPSFFYLCFLFRSASHVHKHVPCNKTFAAFETCAVVRPLALVSGRVQYVQCIPARLLISFNIWVQAWLCFRLVQCANSLFILNQWKSWSTSQSNYGYQRCCRKRLRITLPAWPQCQHSAVTV